jgi:hypothetical protein
MTTRSLYRGRPDWTTYTTYHNGSTEAFLHCGHCLSVIPKESVRCRHCAVSQEKRKANFEAFLKSKQAEETFI